MCTCIGLVTFPVIFADALPGDGVATGARLGQAVAGLLAAATKRARTTLLVTRLPNETRRTGART